MTALVLTDEQVSAHRLVLRKHAGCPDCHDRHRCTRWVAAYDALAVALLPAWDSSWDVESATAAAESVTQA